MRDQGFTPSYSHSATDNFIEARSDNRFENEFFFGLKKGQDLEDRAAHVYAHQEFPGEPGGMQEQAQTVQRKC